VAKPLTPMVVTSFRGENDTAPSTEIDDAQGALVQNLYVVNGGLERRLGGALINTTLGSVPIQGMQWCRLDPNLAGVGSGAAETASVSLLSPLDPTVSAYLQLYLRSDQITASDGTAISAWPDISGNARDAAQATAANQPIIRYSTSVNGKRMVEFDGNNDLMQGTFPFGPGIDITNGVSIYIYCNETALTTGGFNAQNIFGCGNSASAFELYTRTSVALGVGYPDQEYGSNSGNVRDSFGATALGAQMLTLQFLPPASATAEIKLWKNGVQLGVTQANWQATDIRSGYSVGNGGGANEGFDGYIGAVLVYNYAHSAATRAAIENWLIDFFEG
jgi:hypothetical protein